jgi:hypothetical protein
VAAALSKGGISLFKPGKGGNIRARWGAGRARVDFNTQTKDPAQALARAADELRRRSATSSAGPSTRAAAAAAPTAPQTMPPGAPGAPSPAAADTGARRPLGDALARVLGLSTPAPAATSSGAAASTPTALAPDAILDAGARAAEGEIEKAAAEKVRHVHKVVGKACTYGLEGALKRMCRWAGREPEDMDDDEQELIREGFEELAAKYLGTKKISPAGKVLAGGIAAGFGMYIGGKEIPKPKPAPALQLVPPAQLSQRPPAPDDGGGKDAGA